MVLYAVDLWAGGFDVVNSIYSWDFADLGLQLLFLPVIVCGYFGVLQDLVDVIVNLV